MGGIAGIISGGLGLAGSALGMFGGDGENEPQVGYTQPMYPLQMEALDKVLSMFLGQLGKGVPSYPGRRVAGMTEPMQEVEDTLMHFLTGKHPTRNMMKGYFKSLFGQPFDYYEEDVQEWLQNAVAEPALRNWRQDVIPGITEQFAGMDAFDSGATRRAISESGADLMSDIDAILANTLFQERRAWEQRKERALPMMMEWEEQPLEWLNVAAPMSQIGRGVEQDQLSADYMDWLTEQPYNNPWIQKLMPYVFQQYQQPYTYPPETDIFTKTRAAMPGMLGSGSLLYTGLRGLLGGGGGTVTPQQNIPYYIS